MPMQTRPLRARVDRTSRHQIRHLLVLAVLVTSTPTLALAQAPRWQLGVSPSLIRGTYGTEVRTDIWYTPLVARWLFDAGDLTAIVPYTCVRGSDDVTLLEGVAVRTGTPRAAVFRGHTTCGLGDIVLRSRYYLVDERGALPTIAVRAHVKAPTASADLRLGTGRPDGGVGVEVSRSAGGGVLLMLDGGYTWIGRPDGMPYRNRWWYDAGISRTLPGSVVDLAVFFEDYQAIVAGLPNARDILTVVSLRSSSGWRLQVAGQVGLSDGAPDLGLTVGASRRF